MSLKKHLAKLKQKQHLQRISLAKRIKLPALHKGAALVMLAPLALQPILNNVFVIERIEFSMPKLIASTPLLNTFDLTHFSLANTEFVINGFNYSAVIFLPLFLLAVVISQWLVRRSMTRQTANTIENEPSQANHMEGLEELNREVLPIWNRQIESARRQSEIAVNELAQQFFGISTRLNTSIEASVNYANDGASNIGNRDTNATGMISQQELAEMLDALKEAIDVKSVLLEKINELKEQTNEMKEVVSAVIAVSRRTEILAINASIESRRAGEHGKSFSIVAQEVRKLSEQSEKMVNDVDNRIHLLEQKMDEVIAQTNINANGPQDLEKNSDKTMSMYERFRMLALSLSKSSEILLAESANIRNEISQILVDLQYQDRTSQILIHVTDDMEALVSALEKNTETNTYTLDVEKWLEKLFSTYTSEEEKLAHNGEEIDFNAPQKDQNSIDFF